MLNRTQFLFIIRKKRDYTPSHGLYRLSEPRVHEKNSCHLRFPNAQISLSEFISEHDVLHKSHVIRFVYDSRKCASERRDDIVVSVSEICRPGKNTCHLGFPNAQTSPSRNIRNCP